MTEFAAPLPPARDRLSALQLAGIATGAGLIAAGALTLARPHVQTVAVAPARPVETHTRPKHHEPHATAQLPAPSAAALAAEARVDAAAARLAASGFARDLFTETGNRELATARRVAGYRPQIVRAARGSGFSPNVLEGIAYVETARGNGFAYARARSRNLASMTRRAGPAASLRRTGRESGGCEESSPGGPCRTTRRRRSCGSTASRTRRCISVRHLIDTRPPGGV